jgi:hypothetical protein
VDHRTALGGELFLILDLPAHLALEDHEQRWCGRMQAWAQLATWSHGHILGNGLTVLDGRFSPIRLALVFGFHVRDLVMVLVGGHHRLAARGSLDPKLLGGGLGGRLFLRAKPRARRRHKDKERYQLDTFTHISSAIPAERWRANRRQGVAGV